MVNTGAVIAAVGSILVAIFTTLGAWFARKSDRNAKLTQRYFDDAEFNINMVSSLRSDYWTLYRILNIVANKWHMLLDGLPECCNDNEEVRALMAKIGDFPDIPPPRHVEMERTYIHKMHKNQHSNAKEESKEG